MKGAGWTKLIGGILMLLMIGNPLFAQVSAGEDSSSMQTDSSASSFLSSLGSKTSLRNDFAVIKDTNNTQMPLSYQYIRPQDAIWGKRVWEQIDTRQKMNQSFVYPGHDEKGNSMTFINILMQAVMTGEVTAFDPIDDRFTTPLSPDQVENMVVGKAKAVEHVNLETGITTYDSVRSEFDPKSVTFYELKEDWIFDKQTSRLYNRIIGLAPMQAVYNEDGTVRGYKMLFWLYFPDLRPTLAKYDVYNSKNFYQRMSWDDLFAMRYFSGHIIKEDNALGRSLKDIIPGETQEDGIKRLLEGRRIHDEIQDYEQNLWIY